MADKIHCVKKTLRLTPAESRLLSEKAEAFHMNEAEYLRLLISQTPNDYPEIRQELKQLINEVNHIGVNINRIVHHHNYELFQKRTDSSLWRVFMVLLQYKRIFHSNLRRMLL